MAKRRRVGVEIDEALAKQLRIRCAELDLRINDAISQAVELWLKNRKAK